MILPLVARTKALFIYFSAGDRRRPQMTAPVQYPTPPTIWNCANVHGNTVSFIPFRTVVLVYIEV